MRRSELRRLQVQTIESTEAELKKLRDQRAEPSAGDVVSTPKPLTALEQQQKRLEEARERVGASR